MTVESLADILEQDLEEAVEVKNKKSLHRYITLLTENIVRKDRYEREHTEFREVFLQIGTRIEEGFRRMDEHFGFMDKRFTHVEKRFEQVDKRFEQVEKKFEQVDKRFEQVEKRFEQVEKRFEQSDKRFESMQADMNRRFEKVDERFESMDVRFNRVTAFLTAGFAFLAVLITVFRFLS